MNMQKRPPVATAGAGELDLLGKSRIENSPAQLQDQEQPSEPVTDPEKLRPSCVTDQDEARDFCWRRDRSDVICHRQPKTACYRNVNDLVVLRQEAEGDDEDPVLVFAHAVLPQVIRALADQLGGEVASDVNDALIGRGL